MKFSTIILFSTLFLSVFIQPTQNLRMFLTQDENALNNVKTEKPVAKVTVVENKTEKPVVAKVAAATIENKTEKPVAKVALTTEIKTEKPVVAKAAVVENKTEKPVVAKVTTVENKTEKPVVAKTAVVENKTEKPVARVAAATEIKTEKPVVAKATEKSVVAKTETPVVAKAAAASTVIAKSENNTPFTPSKVVDKNMPQPARIANSANADVSKLNEKSNLNLRTSGSNFEAVVMKPEGLPRTVNNNFNMVKRGDFSAPVIVKNLAENKTKKADIPDSFEKVDIVKQLSEAGKAALDAQNSPE